MLGAMFATKKQLVFFVTAKNISRYSELRPPIIQVTRHDMDHRGFAADHSTSVSRGFSVLHWNQLLAELSTWHRQTQAEVDIDVICQCP